MIFIFLSALLFGLVHPGSKLILGTGIDLFSFCLLYILIRLLVQMPIIFRRGWHKIQGQSGLLILLSIGVVGALLQLTEFVGISKGVPVPLVTFLVYSHPIWGIFLNRLINKERVTRDQIFKVAAGIVGIFFVIGDLGRIFSTKGVLLLGPLAAGFFISCWVCLSSKAQKQGMSHWTVSFYYDVFALLTLVIIKSTGGTWIPSSDLGAWLAQSGHLSSIIFYSVFIGLLPNLLFYKGSGQVSAITAGLILLIEPVISSATSTLLWHQTLSETFFFGAALILLAGSGLSVKGAINMTGFTYRHVQRRLSAVVSIVVFVLLFSLSSMASEIDLVEIAPADQADYTVSSELKQIEVAADMALVEIKSLFPDCSIHISREIERGSEDKLIQAVETITKKRGTEERLIVGMSRSNFARVAAKAASGSPVRAISIGAATAQLSTINPNFMSIVSPWDAQWKAIRIQMTKVGCDPSNTVGFFDPTDHLSNNFKEAFSKEFGTQNAHLLEEYPQSGRKNASMKCVFVGTSFSYAEQKLPKVFQEGRAVSVFGIGDWNYHSQELMVALKDISKDVIVYVPTGWTPDVSAESKRFSETFKEKFGAPAGPVAAYTYDSLIVGSLHLCRKRPLSSEILKALKGIPLLRHYTGISSGGNFESKMNIVRFGGAAL